MNFGRNGFHVSFVQTMHPTQELNLQLRAKPRARIKMDKTKDKKRPSRIREGKWRPPWAALVDNCFMNWRQRTLTSHSTLLLGFRLVLTRTKKVLDLKMVF